ncbi:hypothetical protein CHS0354_002123, partial [Potamilus streckersoni]
LNMVITIRSSLNSVLSTRACHSTGLRYTPHYDSYSLQTQERHQMDPAPKNRWQIVQPHLPQQGT